MFPYAFSRGGAGSRERGSSLCREEKQKKPPRRVDAGAERANQLRERERTTLTLACGRSPAKRRLAGAVVIGRAWAAESWSGEITQYLEYMSI